MHKYSNPKFKSFLEDGDDRVHGLPNSERMGDDPEKWFTFYVFDEAVYAAEQMVGRDAKFCLRWERSEDFKVRVKELQRHGDYGILHLEVLEFLDKTRPLVPSGR